MIGSLPTMDKPLPSLRTQIGKTQTLKGIFKKIEGEGILIFTFGFPENYESIQKRKNFEIILEKYMPQEAIFPYESDICYYLIR